ncbi:hypothetical protein BpHYR1_017957, partial [Brachionus plicatilis]
KLKATSDIKYFQEFVSFSWLGQDWFVYSLTISILTSQTQLKGLCRLIGEYNSVRMGAKKKFRSRCLKRTNSLKSCRSFRLNYSKIKRPNRVTYFFDNFPKDSVTIENAKFNHPFSPKFLGHPVYFVNFGSNWMKCGHNGQIR